MKKDLIPLLATAVLVLAGIAAVLGLRVLDRYGPITLAARSAATPRATQAPPNPLEARRAEFADRVYGALEPLGADGKLDADEQSIVDAIAWIRDGMIPDETRRPYWTNVELEDMQEDAAKAAVESHGSRAAAELLRGLRENFGKRWFIPMSVFRHPVVFANAGNGDSDGDGLSDLAEIRQGTNPYERLETDPRNPSERWMVLANGFQAGQGFLPSAQEALFVYHIARRNGYPDDHISLFLETYLEPDPVRIVKPPPWLGRYGGMDLLTEPGPVEVDFRDGARTNDALLRALDTPGHDGNDTMTFHFDGHGSSTAIGYATVMNIPGPPLLHTSLSKAISDALYGRAFLFISSSYAGAFAASLSISGTALAFTSRDANHSVGSAIWNIPVAEALDHALPVVGLRSELSHRVYSEYNPFYWKDGRRVDDLPEARWANPFVYLPSIAR